MELSLRTQIIRALPEIARSLYQWLIPVIMLSFLFSISSRVRLWVRFVLYFIIVQTVALLMLPVAFIRAGDPKNFLLCTRVISKFRSLLGIRWELCGRENIRDKAYIVVSNHQSSLDAFGMMVNWEAFHPVAPVMKSELKYALTFGLFCSLSGGVFVDRGSAKGREALQKGLEEAKRTKKSLWIFPEGTRNRNYGQLLPFKKGAFHMAIQAKMPVLPVIFSDYSSFYHKLEQRFDSGTATLTVLPEISTENMTVDDVSELCAKTQAIMAEQLQKKACSLK